MANSNKGNIEKSSLKIHSHINRVYSNEAKQKKKIIIYHRDSGFLLTDYEIDTVLKCITGKIMRADPRYFNYANKINVEFDTNTVNPRKNYLRYKSKNSEYATNQFGIFIHDSIKFHEQRAVIPFSGINKIVMLEPNYLRTGFFFVSRTVAYSSLSLAAILLIACNCPYVYTSDGTNFNLTGVMFPGAVYKNIERNDYLRLDSREIPKSGYQFKIMNLKKEHQFTNLFELMVVNHAKGVQVFTDKEGTVHTCSATQLPFAAYAAGNHNHLNEVSRKDQVSYSFDDPEEKEPLSSLILSFAKPAPAKSGKLLLSAKNTAWSGYAYNEICKLLGDKYEEWVKRQTLKTKSELVEGSLKQGLPLKVYIKTKKGWEYKDYYNVAGTLAYRDMLMILDLSEITGDTIQIKLECGFKFWELDYAGIDFSIDEKVSVDVMKPISAKDSLGVEHLNALLGSDSNYLAHYNINDYVTVSFNKIPINETMEQTVFIHSKGYYNRTDTYSGKPDYKELMKVRKPGGFSIFSRNKFLEIQKSFSAFKKENELNY